jgi:hypothetical protein
MAKQKCPFIELPKLTDRRVPIRHFIHKVLPFIGRFPVEIKNIDDLEKEIFDDTVRRLMCLQCI